MFSKSFALLAASAALLALATPSSALSWELCDSYASEWVTDSPHLEGKFPFYSLIFSCNGGLNIEGKQVDACVNNGTACGQPAADAFCKYIGFDGANPDMEQTAPADEPVRAVTGEWCVSQGNYQDLGALNRTQFDDLASVNANKQHCNRLTSATCYRRRDTMGKVFEQLQANATQAAPQQTAVQQSVIRTAATAGATATSEPANMAVTAVGGRRLKGFAQMS
ncbi:hypothetical protein CVIRNUC_005004 [Coccomyxa viridis]|uniref:Uncharacterized protein n=1 Tax=Coccomyxa viridis TaxID=1274662 RepID=A0AAV1I4N0_9CHLO|nr:hypothetical protein CVIRNUC_005004 [Coccomyxa viridis]